MKPKIIELDYTYKKEGQEVWVLDLDDVPIDKSLVADQRIVHLAPKSLGGNHKHQRSEWLIGIGEDLIFAWLDADNNLHEEQMHPDGKIRLIIVPPQVPHAVVNKSAEKVGVLFEFSDSKSSEVEKVQVV